MRKFEKISFEQFKKDISNDKKLYEEYILPTRGTKNAAGYDFYALFDYTLKPGDIMKIPTGIKVQMEDDDVLFLIDRSSMGFKWNVRMCNQVGVIDADYYNNESNEGHILIKLKNEGEHDYKIELGSAIAQGIILSYNTIDNEEEIDNIRTGGTGSTDQN